MKLMTKELERLIPKLYEEEDTLPADKMIYTHYFHPYGKGDWWVAEYDPIERLCFGYASIQGGEWGYFSLDELESLKGFGGINMIERDLSWKPIKFGEIKHE